MSGWPPPISASAARPGNFVRWARNQKLTTVDFPATRWAGPARVIDTEARWEQARWLLHDDGVRPEDRAAGLLVLLYAKQPPAISRLTLDHVQASGDEVRLMLGREPEPLASLILQVCGPAARAWMPWPAPSPNSPRSSPATAAASTPGSPRLKLTTSPTCTLLPAGPSAIAPPCSNGLTLPHSSEAVEGQRQQDQDDQTPEVRPLGCR